MATERKDRGPKMPTKPKLTRPRELPESEIEKVATASDMRKAAERRDRGTGMPTKPKISRDREWPKLAAKKAAGKKVATRGKKS